MIFCLGGAFNPPTLAHKAIYEAVKKRPDFDRFIFLPVGDQYAKDMVHAHHRIAMLTAMTKHDEAVIIDPLETNDATYQGARESLRRLESAYQAPVVFVLGTDQAITLPTWKQADSLLSEFQFLIIQRPGTDADRFDALKASAPGAIYDILHLDLPISSTAYRTTKDVRLLDSNVATYIAHHDLY